MSVDFFNWNKVKIRYCDGASFAGHPESEFKHGTKLLFRGQLIWEAVMKELLAIGMAKAKQALLSGCSAGGLATLIHCDEFRGLLSKDATVKCPCLVLLFLIFLVWAYVPEPWLHAVGIFYYPSRYWALAIPTYVMVVIVLAIGFYLGLNFMSTPPPTSLNTIFDEFSREPSNFLPNMEEEDQPIEPISDISIDKINALMFNDNPSLFKNYVLLVVHYKLPLLAMAILPTPFRWKVHKASQKFTSNLQPVLQPGIISGVPVYKLSEISKAGFTQDAPDPTLPICWRAQSPMRSILEVKQYFKTLTLQFGSRWKIISKRLTIQPEGYLIINNKGNVCLDIFDGSEVLDGSTIILGDISLRGKMVVCDNTNKKIGWSVAAHSDCSARKF